MRHSSESSHIIFFCFDLCGHCYTFISSFFRCCRFLELIKAEIFFRWLIPVNNSTTKIHTHTEHGIHTKCTVIEVHSYKWGCENGWAKKTVAHTQKNSAKLAMVHTHLMKMWANKMDHIQTNAYAHSNILPLKNLSLLRRRCFFPLVFVVVVALARIRNIAYIEMEAIERKKTVYIWKCDIFFSFFMMVRNVKILPLIFLCVECFWWYFLIKWIAYSMNIYKCVSERDALYSYVLYASNELIKLSHFYEWQIKKTLSHTNEHKYTFSLTLQNTNTKYCLEWEIIKWKGKSDEWHIIH